MKIVHILIVLLIAIHHLEEAQSFVIEVDKARLRKIKLLNYYLLLSFQFINVKKNI
jgi:hypothetical protein